MTLDLEAQERRLADFAATPFLVAKATLAADVSACHAEIRRLRTENTELRHVTGQWQADHTSEQDRRVAAQEAITGHWQPSVERLIAERDEARAEVAELRNAVLPGLYRCATEAMALALHVSPPRADDPPIDPLLRSFGAVLLIKLREMNAPNYLTFRCTDLSDPSIDVQVFTIPAGGKSPQQLREEAEAERDEARAEVERWKAEAERLGQQTLAAYRCAGEANIQRDRALSGLPVDPRIRAAAGAVKP